MNKESGHRPLDRSTVEFLRELAFDRRFGGKSLIENLAYGSASLYWYLDLPLYYAVERSRQLSLGADPKSKVRQMLGTAFSRSKLRIFVVLALFHLMARTVLRFVFGKCARMARRTADKNRVKAEHAVLVSSSSWSWRASNIMPNRIKRDEMVGNVIDKLLMIGGIKVVACDTCEQPRGFGIGLLLEKGIFSSSTWRPMEAYLTLSKMKNAVSLWMKYRRVWNNMKLRGFHDYVAGLTLDTGISENLRTTTEKFFSVWMLNALLQIESIRGAIEEERINLVLTYGDHCVFGRSAIIAGISMRKPTVAFQMALISPSGREYRYSPEEIVTVPVPDVVAVNGKLYQDILVNKSSYSPNRVVVIGQPRYDMLVRENSYSKEAFCTRHGIDPGKRILLVTTPPTGLEVPLETKERLLSMTLHVAAELEDMEVVIKPHPRESQKHYSGLMRDRKGRLHVLGSRSDVYEALFACDVILTYGSTTALEAAILKKPVIIANLGLEGADEAYVRPGIALGVEDSDSLIEALRAIFYDKRVRERLETAREKFVFDRTFIQDGRASQRLVDMLVNLMNRA